MMKLNDDIKNDIEELQYKSIITFPKNENYIRKEFKPLVSYEGFYSFFKDNILTKRINTTKTKNLRATFYGCVNLSKITFLNEIDTRNVITFEALFSGDKKLENFDGIENWITNKCINFADCFYGTGLSTLKYFKNWEFKNNCNCRGMFMYSQINSLEGLNEMKFIDVKNGNFMFAYTQITDLKGSEGFDLSKFNTVQNMFKGCKKLKDISVFKTWKHYNEYNPKIIFNECPLIDSSQLN